MNRKALLHYFSNMEKINTLKAETDSLKAELVKAFTENSSIQDEKSKTVYNYCTVRADGVSKYAVYKSTQVSGSIDWQAYALALGGNKEDAAQYQKAGHVSQSIAWATAKQSAEIEKGENNNE